MASVHEIRQDAITTEFISIQLLFVKLSVSVRFRYAGTLMGRRVLFPSTENKSEKNVKSD